MVLTGVHIKCTILDAIHTARFTLSSNETALHFLRGKSLRISYVVLNLISILCISPSNIKANSFFGKRKP